jgi:hypothetical protein
MAKKLLAYIGYVEGFEQGRNTLNDRDEKLSPCVTQFVI